MIIHHRAPPVNILKLAKIKGECTRKQQKNHLSTSGLKNQYFLSTGYKQGLPNQLK